MRGGEGAGARPGVLVLRLTGVSAELEPSPSTRSAAALPAPASVVAPTELEVFRALLNFTLDDFQVAGCEALEAGRGVLVAAPTGAGKTVVGEFAVHLALAGGRKAFYTTPIKALSNQKYGDLVRRYGPDAVGLLTGDTTVNGEAPIVVMTTEVLRNMLYAGSRTLDGLGYVVMDEVHYLADRFRGPVWEEVIIHLAPDVQLVSLSATVSNAEEFGDWLKMVRGDTAVVVSEHRPVPLGQHVLTRGELCDLYAGHVDPTAPGVNPPISPELADARRRRERAAGESGPGGRGPRGRGDRGYRGGGYRSGGDRPGGPNRSSFRPTPRFAVVTLLAGAGLLPAIVFIFSRAGCQGAVGQCLAAGLRLTTPAQEAQIRQIVSDRCATLPPEDLAVLGYDEWLEALARGLAAHHAGMLPIFKETVEELFSRGLVQVVFATETLALGINMPAKSVVLEKLVKWDGSAHVDITPGEYTQLTGRAGRRGIDIEGHAVVVEHPGLDPIALAGLASKRLYPLRSSFTPTYNMAVNLVAQVGRERAREVLETSFAQFQADRGVVGLAKQAKAHAEALEGYDEAMRCHLGDFAEFAGLRRAISDREHGLTQEASRERRAVAARSLQGLHVGDVLEIPTGRRAGHAVVLDPGTDAGVEGPRPTLLMDDRQVRRVSIAEVPDGVRTIGSLRIPRGFNGRNPAARRALSADLRAWLPTASASRGGKRRPPKGHHAAAEDAELAALRRRVRAHPCQGCPDREDHARWAERADRLRREHAALLARIEGRTSSIARVFDRICDVLQRLGYHTVGQGREDEPEQAGARTTSEHRAVTVTADGQWLRRLYAENDLLVAECLRRGVWADLDAPALAAAVSTVVYSARRDDREGAPRIPGGPDGKLGRALEQTAQIWSELEELEGEHQIESTGPLDLGLVEVVHRWAAGRSLEAVLKSTDLAAGDFVRWCKQIIDLLDQIAQAAPDPRVREAAHRGIRGLRRGVVAYSSL